MAKKPHPDSARYVLTFDQSPLMYGRLCRMVVQGPAEALALALLWDVMLCGLSTARNERAKTLVNDPDDLDVSFSSVGTGYRSYGLPQQLPDRTWHALFAQTAAQLEWEVHCQLWAPYADPATGQLPQQELHQWVHQRTPIHLRHPLGRKRVHQFLGNICLHVAPTATLALPHLELLVAEPVKLMRDQDNTLHHPGGPALVFADGHATYFWRGHPVPPQWLPQPDRDWALQAKVKRSLLLPRPAHQPPTAAQALTLPNLEDRRAACEIIGWDTVVSQLNPATVDVDPDPTIGTLLLVNMPVPSPWGGENRVPAQFLRVQCGTGRTFSLAVPPTMRTARQANAWTYGLEPGEYAPEVRT